MINGGESPPCLLYQTRDSDYRLEWGRYGRLLAQKFDRLGKRGRVDPEGSGVGFAEAEDQEDGEGHGKSPEDQRGKDHGVGLRV